MSELNTQERPRHALLRGVYAVYLAFMVIFLGLTPFLALLLHRETDLTKNVLPVLIGFCLQGSFLVVLFGLADRQARLTAMRNHKIILRGCLDAVVFRCLLFRHSPIRVGGFACAPAALIEVEKQVASVVWDEALAQRVIAQAGQELPALQALHYLASLIDYEHLAVWSEVVADLRAVRDADHAGAVRDAMIRLLGSVARFDQLILV